MKSLLVVMMVSAAFLGGTVYANEDAMHEHEQAMKDCMAKQPTTMSKDDAHKACKEQLKKEHDEKMKEEHK